MIEKLHLRFGRSPGATEQQIAATPITVFVGPNNSGKSKILSEIEQYCRSGQENGTSLILKSIDFEGLSIDEIPSIIAKLIQEPHPSEVTPVNHVLIGSRYGRQHVPMDKLTEILKLPKSQPHLLCQWFLTHNTLMLNGQSRINLINQQPAGDLQQPPQSSLQVLFRDDAKRHEVRRIINEAFGSYFVIDPTNLGTLRIKLSSRAPISNFEERGIHAEAVKFHSEAQSIEFASDGVKAFTGIITEVMAGDPQVVLIDEPEAFLHPSLASKLGMEVSQAALKQNKRVFVSTHSPTFVMGCIQSGAPVTIVRLTYRESVATARVLPSGDILKLMRNPLLRSTGVLSGLFYEFVVVTESDSDRAFYQEINERLLRFKPEWGIPNCLFINAQNKQTIQTIIRPLRQLGIPAVGIVDIDVLKEGGTVWSNLVDSISVPEISQGGLSNIRAAVKKAMDDSGKNMKRDGGIQILENSELEAAQNLLDQMFEYGIAIVPGGELESWIKELSASGHGPAWLIEVFEKMGEDPTQEFYVKPTDNDVWAFMNKIKEWLFNQRRKGIPA